MGSVIKAVMGEAPRYPWASGGSICCGGQSPLLERNPAMQAVRSKLAAGHFHQAGAALQRLLDDGHHWCAHPQSDCPRRQQRTDLLVDRTLVAWMTADRDTAVSALCEALGHSEGQYEWERGHLEGCCKFLVDHGDRLEGRRAVLEGTLAGRVELSPGVRAALAGLSLSTADAMYDIFRTNLIVHGWLGHPLPDMAKEVREFTVTLAALARAANDAELPQARLSAMMGDASRGDIQERMAGAGALPHVERTYGTAMAARFQSKQAFLARDQATGVARLDRVIGWLLGEITSIGAMYQGLCGRIGLA